MAQDSKLILLLGELKGTSDAILEQAKKTNGRVTDLEDRVDRIEKKEEYARGYSRGRAAVLAALCVTLGFVVGQVIVPFISQLGASIIPLIFK